MKLFILALALASCFSPVFAQDQPTQQPSAEELEKQKAEREKNAYRLLDQVIDEAQSLRLVENRVRIQISAADMLWDQNQGRARTLFTSAADSIAEMGRSQPAADTNRRTQTMVQDGASFVFQAPFGPVNFRLYQVRQELVLAAARHDAALAYQLLAATKPPPSPQPTADPRGPRPELNSEETLEQTLLGRIAALDPKLAAQNAEQMMDKGQFPMTIPEVINQLYRQDADAAEKLGEKTVKKIQAANILSKSETGNLVQMLLRGGPRPPAQNQDAKSRPMQTFPLSVLSQSAYVDLLSSVVEAALKATPATQTNQRRGPANPRGRGAGLGQQNNQPQPPTDAQIEQNNARRLLAGLQAALPLVDQFLPSKAPLVRQKLSELGLSTSSSPSLAGVSGDLNIDALVQAAASAPPAMQARLYQQAANRALEEGDTERARQIATDHLQRDRRDSMIQRVDLRELLKKAEGARFEEIRQSVARLQTDNEKITLLIQVANNAQKSNAKLALQLLEEAKQMVNRRATSYEHFEQQLKVAHAYASIDPAQSFDLLDPGINQLNELLQAASVLNGFEMNMFRDGEMTMLGGNGLTATLNRYGQELAVLARTDFDRSDVLAGRFQFAEPRIMVRMAIVQGLLDVKPLGPRNMVSLRTISSQD